MGEVRVQLNWDLLKRSMTLGITTVSLVHTSKWNPATLYAPWYKDSAGMNVPHDADAAQPWRYDELIEDREVQPFDYELITEEAARIAVLESAKVLSLEVGSDEHLILDGNHRLMLRLGQLAHRDTVLPWYRIHAPLNSLLVPDTVHFSHGPFFNPKK